MRTKDWACYLCGYPLASPGFKLIDKTYGQIREERLYGRKTAVQEDEQIDESYEQEMQDVPLVTDNNIYEGVNAAQNDNTIIEEELSKEPVSEQGSPSHKTITETEAVHEVEDEPEAENNEQEAISEEIKPLECTMEATETIAESEDAEVEDETETSDEEVVNSATAVLPIEEEPCEEPIQAEPESVAPADIDITIDELLEEYACDYTSATNKYLNKRLRLSGYAAAIDVKEVLAINYIRMTDASLTITKSVQCMFDKKYANTLKSLEKGQQITVQGKYTGSLIAMRMTDCIVVQS
ncbi:MAG: hypothetical protein PHF74_07740 [Dehalococcoidales bacterium]|nr:hypothetical protein [Dehalococcoidales bacterium]